MKWSLLRNGCLYTRKLLLLQSPSTYKLNPCHSLAAFTRSQLRLYSSDDSNSTPTQNQNQNQNQDQNQNSNSSIDVPDVSNKELKTRLEKYFKGDEEALPSILEAILQRKLNKNHEETDDELNEELRMQPLDDIPDNEFESDFEEMHETDEEIADLYDAGTIVKKRMMEDELFNMNERKWDKLVEEGVNVKLLKDTKDCEDILQDMLNWDNLLPDEIKKKVEERFNELGEMCERGELEPQEAYDLFKKFEDEMVLEYHKMLESQGPPQFDEPGVLDKKKNLDDPPGEGPILRWQTRVVFAPGGDAWHPKNRKVKMSVTVKELGLSKHQFRRLRDLVGKRYHPGKDELTITSERFEHREENRKDCLRTLYSLIEEAGKANKLVEDARASYVKQRLRANPAFMERLHAKTMRIRESDTIAA